MQCGEQTLLRNHHKASAPQCHPVLRATDDQAGGLCLILGLEMLNKGLLCPDSTSILVSCQLVVERITDLSNNLRSASSAQDR